MYLKCQMEHMPTGPGIFWEKTTDAGKIWRKNVMTDGHSFKAQQWLTYLQDNDPDLEIAGTTQRYKIQSKFYRGEFSPKTKEKRKWTVDGMAETSAGHPKYYEFLGCHYHPGCPICDPAGKDEAFWEKVDFLRQTGVVYYIYECQWDQLLTEIEDKFTPTLPHILEDKHSDEDILRSIENDQLFGYIVCDLITPPELVEKFKNFPPVIKRMKITDELLSPYMAQQWRKRGAGAKLDRETVIQCFNASQHLLMTPLVKHYLSIGLKIPKIYKVVQYQPYRSLGPFVKHVTGMRLEAERSKKMTKANSAKVFGNSGYGKVCHQILLSLKYNRILVGRACKQVHENRSF